MDPNLTSFLHVSGVVLLFTGYGMLFAAAFQGKPEGGIWKAGNGIAGTGLLLTLLFGFARIHTFGWPLWGFLKIGLWLFLAVVPVFLRKSDKPGGILALTLAAGIAAIALVYFKPT